MVVLNYLRNSTKKVKWPLFKRNSWWFLYPTSCIFPRRLPKESKVMTVPPKVYMWKPIRRSTTEGVTNRVIEQPQQQQQEQQQEQQQRQVSTCLRCVPITHHCSAIPKPRHVHKKKYAQLSQAFGYAGEDSYFSFVVPCLQSNEYSSNIFVGVADGVGRWRKDAKSQEAAVYAQSLLKYSIEFIQSQVTSSEPLICDTKEKRKKKVRI
ncbi:hypothetical protein RFI_07014 [Reticulomyxa filosa]|uniref:Uncharacterized protein n=1 Tax=Reticulomyxa filosa TaxID=46433 RepID=X6NUX1_RETFI|nr:hypothetical protein RFI_07014 [Reticulomyxa filosa]|eukprot:ETO30105.1 hypothetical protein RFI_07014 [Reticulomyxa filosa]